MGSIETYENEWYGWREVQADIEVWSIILLGGNKGALELCDEATSFSRGGGRLRHRDPHPRYYGRM